MMFPYKTLQFIVIFIILFSVFVFQIFSLRRVNTATRRDNVIVPLLLHHKKTSKNQVFVVMNKVLIHDPEFKYISL